MQALAIQPDGCYLDGTYGRGGHARAILERLGPTGRLLGMDRDPQAIADGLALAASDRRFEMARGPFSGAAEQLTERGWMGRVNGLFLDLGVSSPQLDQAERGFSFDRDGPLDMRMDPERGESAAEWLAHAERDEISRVLFEFGEERFARRIASRIVEERGPGKLKRTRELADLVARAVPRRERNKHPATRSFQAIRIQVNDELGELTRFLSTVCDALAQGGRLAVISFHSLEDRIVKRFIRDQSRGDPIPKGLPVMGGPKNQRLKPIGGAVKASEAEVAVNPRSRSAVLRAAQRL